MSASPEERLAQAGAFARGGLPGGTPRPVPRFGHGSRVPGWDRAADLEKEPAGIPDPETTDVPADLRAEIEGHMANYPDPLSAALPALAAAQRVHGWCSPEALKQVACVMRVTPAYLESVASFYDMLETTPVGRHSVYVCTNISCSLRGADALYEAIAQAAEGGIDGEPVNVRPFECLGACDIAPMASVDGVYVGPLTPQEAPQLIEDLREGRPVLPERQLARRLVADPRANSTDYPEHAAERPRGARAANLELPTESPQSAIGSPGRGERPEPAPDGGAREEEPS